MHTVPQPLIGRVDPRRFSDFMTALEQNLEGQGVCCPTVYCVILPILPFWCGYAMCHAKRRFDRILTETCKEWAPAFGNGTAVAWKLIQQGGEHDHEAALGYNIVFNLRALPTRDALGGGGAYEFGTVQQQPQAHKKKKKKKKKHSGGGGGGAAEVKQLMELREQGVLSEDEFTAAKKKALGI